MLAIYAVIYSLTLLAHFFFLSLGWQKESNEQPTSVLFYKSLLSGG